MDVKLFAVLRDRAGADRISVALAPPVTTDALLAELGRVCPALAAHLPVCRVAVNRKFSKSGDTIEEGDEVALIPPVSGG